MTWKVIWNCDQKNHQKLWPEKWPGGASRKMTNDCDQKNDLNLWPEKCHGKRPEIATRKMSWNYYQKNDMDVWPGKRMKIATRKMTRKYDLKNFLGLRPGKWRAKIATRGVTWTWLVTGKMSWKTIWNCDQKNNLKLWPKNDQERWSGKLLKIATQKMFRYYDLSNDWEPNKMTWDCDHENDQKLRPEK